MDATAKTTAVNTFLVIDPWQPAIQSLVAPAAAETLPIMYEVIECELVDVVCLGYTLDGLNLDLWIDDEGLFKDEQRFFALLDEKGNVQREFAGRGFLAASNADGATVGLSDPLAEYQRIAPRIGFAPAGKEQEMAAAARARADQPQIIIPLRD